jgi:hypothetical protein
MYVPILQLRHKKEKKTVPKGGFCLFRKMTQHSAWLIFSLYYVNLPPATANSRGSYSITGIDSRTMPPLTTVMLPRRTLPISIITQCYSWKISRIVRNLILFFVNNCSSVVFAILNNLSSLVTSESPIGDWFEG